MKIIKKCEFCSSKFETNQPYAKYCSSKCSKKAQHIREKEKYGGVPRVQAYTYTCIHCGNEYHPKTKDRNKFCSRECAYEYKKSKPKEVKKPICVICGNKFDGKSYYKYCSAVCKNIAKKANKPKTCYNIRCTICGMEFEGNRSNMKYCSDRCRKYAENRRAEIRRRHKLQDNGRVDYSITLLKLIKRDKGICHICGKKVNTKTHSNHEEYPSIDHVLPVAKGGTHTWDNVKLAHRGCNNKKRDKMFYEGVHGQIMIAI